ELLLRLLARSLETLRLARARRRGTVGQRRTNLVTAVVRDRFGIRLHARAGSGLGKRGGELREHLVLARRQERWIALLRNFRLAGEESGLLLGDRLQAEGGTLVGPGDAGREHERSDQEGSHDSSAGLELQHGESSPCVMGPDERAGRHGGLRCIRLAGQPKLTSVTIRLRWWSTRSSPAPTKVGENVDRRPCSRDDRREGRRPFRPPAPIPAPAAKVPPRREQPLPAGPPVARARHWSDSAMPNGRRPPASRPRARDPVAVDTTHGPDENPARGS